MVGGVGVAVTTVHRDRREFRPAADKSLLSGLQLARPT
jgi:hypothetical protein